MSETPTENTPKNKSKKGQAATGTPKKKWLVINSQQQFILGVLLLLLSLALLVSFISYFVYGNYDQSTLAEVSDRGNLSQNLLGKFGAYVSDVLIFSGFGLASFIIVKMTASTGLAYLRGKNLWSLRSKFFWDFYAMISLSFLFACFLPSLPILGGMIGFEINSYFEDYVGKFGAILVFLFIALFYFILKMGLSVEHVTRLLDKWTQPSAAAATENEAVTADNELTFEPFAEEQLLAEERKNIIPNTTSPFDEEVAPEAAPLPQAPKTSVFESNTMDLKPTIDNYSTHEMPLSTERTAAPQEQPNTEIIETSDDNFVIQHVEEERVEESLASRLVENFGEFDPTLDLSNYKMPSVELLKEYATGGITINQAELEENKNRIVETLRNYKIDIAQIKATIGPTVTLYEIVPEAGIRISKIKSLEDDIALSLAALGIRIIAPIPGKGTIGIEVPNNNPTMVSMKSVIQSPKFQNAEMELPIALGKNISNETFVVDLAKMPHLLMAGATGQGKSVGLNAILTSLLYKKHPAEVKFVLVDPKKVELTLFNKIERHYLAKLPNTEDAIITDNTKVIHTLNSLCIEMDNRYSLLKDAMVRNIKEYNDKFKQRKLNPEHGHRFLPYIVLVVDEFADLIMTAGKEVETPIARLAQLARAIGIHLIIATQRPSVNVITGIIKANFPARIAFRVTSKIDSRTILDGPGADQLIGRGDLLYTQGNDLTRVQCAFVDTPEVESICDYIGSQKAFADAYLLPEYIGEENGTGIDIDISDRDSLFKEAAEIIVTAQQGSASLLQRKLKLGYNRAGRLIDQLEAAGIVGPFEGSKARSVNYTDLSSLNDFLSNEKK